MRGPGIVGRFTLRRPPKCCRTKPKGSHPNYARSGNRTRLTSFLLIFKPRDFTRGNEAIGQRQICHPITTFQWLSQRNRPSMIRGGSKGTRGFLLLATRYSTDKLTTLKLHKPLKFMLNIK